MLSQEFSRILKTCKVRLEAIIWRLAICYKETPKQNFSYTFCKIFETTFKSMQRRLKGNCSEFQEELPFETRINVIGFSTELWNSEISSVILLKSDSTTGASQQL